MARPSSAREAAKNHCAHSCVRARSRCLPSSRPPACANSIGLAHWLREASQMSKPSLIGAHLALDSSFNLRAPFPLSPSARCRWIETFCRRRRIAASPSRAGLSFEPAVGVQSALDVCHERTGARQLFDLFAAVVVVAASQLIQFNAFARH